MVKEWDWGWMLAAPVGLVSHIRLKQNITENGEEENVLNFGDT